MQKTIAYDLKVKEIKLKLSEEMYRSLFSQMTEGFALYEIIYDENGDAVDYRFLEVNRSFEKLTGLNREALLFKLQTSIFPGENPQFLKIYAEVAKSGIPIHFTDYSPLLERYYDIVAFMPEKGQVATVFNDITQKIQEEEAKNNFIAIMSHELRNPLMPILTHSELIDSYISEKNSDGFDDKLKIKESIDVITRQSKTLVRLLDDLLDISRIISGNIVLKKEVIDVCVPIQNAIDATKSFVSAQKHTLVFSAPKSPIYIDADSVRIEQVITNLVNNSAKYTKPGGKIFIGVKEVGSFAEISISDTGIGMKSADINHIFGMFIRFSKPFAETQGDLGIGLKLIKDIVTMSNGEIYAESKGPNLGSTFIVKLPTGSGAQAVNEMHFPTTQNLPFVVRNILIVDDNKDIAISLGCMLTKLGHNVRLAYDGKNALLVAKKFKPNVALLDIGLPDMSGHEIAANLRMNFGNKILLIALTGYGQEKDKATSKAAGFNIHLVKPVSVKEIARIINAPPTSHFL